MFSAIFVKHELINSLRSVLMTYNSDSTCHCLNWEANDLLEK